MKKKLLFVLLLISMLLTTFSMAATPTAVSAAGAAKITRVALLSADFMEEKGMIFRFQVEGTFQEKQLRGSLLVADSTIRLRCRYQTVKKIVQCTAPGGTAANFAGQAGVVSLNGFRFFTLVPKRKPGL